MSAEGGWRQTAADFFILSTAWRFCVKESAVHVFVVLVVTQLNLKHPTVCCQVILLQLFPFCHWWNFSLWKVGNFHKQKKERFLLHALLESNLSEHICEYSESPDVGFLMVLANHWPFVQCCYQVPTNILVKWFWKIATIFLNCAEPCRSLVDKVYYSWPLIIPLGITLRTRILALLHTKRPNCMQDSTFHISHFIKLFIASTVDTGLNMISDFLCLVFLLMPGKCSESVLYLIIRKSLNL